MKPWAGRGAWVWYTSQAGGIAGAIARAQELQLDWLAFKEADEERIWRQLSRADIEAVKAAGLRCVAWTYAYGSNPAGAGGAIVTIGQMGFDGVIIDAEAELRDAEKRDRTRAEIIDGMLWAVRNGLGWDYPLAVAPLPVMRYHTDLNYDRWPDWGCDLMPQFYTNVLGPAHPVESLFDAWSARFDMSTVYPVYGMYDGEGGRYPTGEELRRFVELCQQYRCPGRSYWRLDTIDGAVWHGGEQVRPFDPRSPEEVQLDVLWGLAEYLPDEQKEQQHAAIIALKGHLGY